jgi:hypothetical protein
MIDSIADSAEAFEKALFILDKQHEDFENKRQQSSRLSNKITALIDNI